MASSNNKNPLKLFGIISVLALSFWAIFYVSTDKYQQNAKQRQERAEAINKTEKAKKADQVVLKKNERHDIGRTSLVYKGVAKDTILVDLYLLDLDPKQSYLKKIKTGEARKELDLGGVKYRLINSNDRYLTLKILRLSLTP
jgi:hypothetical protein